MGHVEDYRGTLYSSSDCIDSENKEEILRSKMRGDIWHMQKKLQLLYGEAEAIQKSRTTSLLWASKTLGTEYRLVHGVYVDCRDKDVCKHDVWEASIHVSRTLWTHLQGLLLRRVPTWDDGKTHTQPIPLQYNVGMVICTCSNVRVGSTLLNKYARQRHHNYCRAH